MASVVEDGAFGYSDASAATTAAVASKLDTTHGFGGAVTADAARALLWLPGLIPALHHVARVAKKRRGCTVTTAIASATPIYYRFLYVGECEDVDVLRVPLVAGKQDANGTYELRFEIDFEGLERALAHEDCGVLMWCNPHNPTGRVWTRAELIRVAQLCVKHDVVLLSDEVWADMVYDEVATPFTGMGALLQDVPGLSERLVVVSSPSKTYNVATCNVAYAAVVDPNLRREFLRAGRDKAETTPFGFAAALSAYTDPACAQWRLRLLAYLRSNRDHVHEVLMREAGPELLQLTRPEATYLTWIDVSRVGVPEYHWENYGVKLTPGKQ